MVADKFTELQKAVGPEITKTDLVPAFQVNQVGSFCLEHFSTTVGIQIPETRISDSSEYQTFECLVFKSHFGKCGPKSFVNRTFSSFF